MAENRSLDISIDLLRFIDASPTPAHAVIQCAGRLLEAGFGELDPKDQWKTTAGGKFFVVRGSSAIIAFKTGDFPPWETGFRIIGAHTDSPCLRLKPKAVYSRQGYVQFGVEVYGGPILATWTDRDLGIAGRVTVRGDDGTVTEVPVFIDRPVCRIPNLAVHLHRDVNEEGLKLNRQEHLPPVVALSNGDAFDESFLRKVLAEGAGIESERILDWRLDLVDVQKGAVGGVNNEFIFSGRIDNLASCHAAVEALVLSEQSGATQVVALFDSEEVGSQTASGAASRLLDHVLERLCIGNESPREAFFRAQERSFMLSVDCAHAVHPNYPEAHEPRHQPILNGGPVLKVNAQERYTTDLHALAHLRQCAERAGLNGLQTFVARTDKPCGSTIGPITASRLGVRSVDIGSPILAMHSIREMGGVEDQAKMIRLLSEHLTTA